MVYFIYWLDFLFLFWIVAPILTWWTFISILVFMHGETMCCQRLMKVNQYGQNVDLLDQDEVHVFPTFCLWFGRSNNLRLICTFTSVGLPEKPCHTIGWWSLINMSKNLVLIDHDQDEVRIFPHSDWGLRVQRT